MTATTTTRLSLYKTSSDGSDLVNVVTDLLNNWDAIDLNIGYRDCTSTTRPSTVWKGLPIRESDTGRLYISNGTSPASGSWKQIPAEGATFVPAFTYAGALSLNSTLAVTGAATLNSTLAVAGTATLSSNLSVAGNETVGGNLAVSGDVTLSSGRIFRNKASTTATTVANTLTETVIATMTIPANEAQFATYRIKAWGIIANAATTPNCQWRLRIGGLAGTQMALISYTFGGASAGTRTWSMEALVTILTTGGSGTWFGQMTGVSNINTTTPTNNTAAPVIQDGTASVTKDTTVTEDMVITATWNAAASANTLTCYGYTAERVS